MLNISKAVMKMGLGRRLRRLSDGRLGGRRRFLLSAVRLSGKWVKVLQFATGFSGFKVLDGAVARTWRIMRNLINTLWILHERHVPYSTGTKHPGKHPN